MWGGDGVTTPDSGASDALVDAADATAEVAVDAGPTGCAALAPNEATDVLVASTGTDGDTCGTTALPCKTVTKGLAIAAATQRPHVEVAAGIYPESIVLAPGVTIEGGWSIQAGVWRAVCDATRDAVVVIRGTTSATVLATNGSSGLRALTIESKPTASSGETLYGIFATGSATKLALDDVVVRVASGGVGDPGVAGTKGADGVGNCVQASSDGANGVGTANGTGGIAGTFDETGYHGGAGSIGGTGGDAHNGIAGGPAGPQSTCTLCPGSCNFLVALVAGLPGAVGCGGKGGGGGGGGNAGGASIGAFAWNATITITNGSVTAGGGGNGGDGAIGGAGGVGNAGAPGADAKCAGFTCVQNTCNATGQSTVVSTGGAAGGKGGDGASGGNGGGGSGGVAFALVEGGTAKIGITGTSLAHGGAGKAGTPGGAAGAAADRYP